MSLKRTVFSAVLQILPTKFRTRLEEAMGRPNLRSALLRLRQYGLEPQYLVDGGANCGDWTRLIRTIWPEASVLCVEPQSAPFDQLNSTLLKEANGSVVAEQVLLGPEAVEAVPFAETGTGASVLLSKADRDAPTREQVRLDNLVQKHFPRVDYLKLDLQGFEVQALEGFKNGLQQCQVVQLELSTLPLIPKAPLLHEVVTYMAECGFLLWEVEEFIRAPRDGAMWQMDAIFLREDSPIRKKRKWD